MRSGNMLKYQKEFMIFPNSINKIKVNNHKNLPIIKRPTIQRSKVFHNFDQLVAKTSPKKNSS